jgi:pyruvate dehydrogenase E2 component (dihydrolipoamide acetyltransferase)
MRQAVAAAVSRSKREIPHYYLATDIDLARARAWLTETNRARPVTNRLLPAALLLKAIALALRKYPDLNGFWSSGAFQASAAIHVGILVSLRGGGLVAPAIHDTDKHTLPDLMNALQDLVRRAREGGLRGSEMTDATITVSNLGDEGVRSVLGVIYPPQVAIVGLGTITDRPWAEQGMLDVRPVVTATLAADHRATDGRYGALFLREIERLVQRPELL